MRKIELIIEIKRRVCMLTAIFDNGRRISLGERWSKEELLHLRKEGTFLCPQCKERVILKLGDKKMYHFSHLKRTECENFYENETEYHMQGKLQLYQWLAKQGMKPELEYFDRRINQRMDIYFTFNNHPYALEYQCSSIQESLYLKRTLGYLKSGYLPLWILGGNQLNRRKQYLTTLNDFHYLFLQKTPSNTWMIPFYCSNTEKFIIHHSIQPVTIRKMISVQKIYETSQISIKNLLIPQNTDPLCPEHWIKEISLFKSQIIRYPGSINNPFLLALYNNYLNISLLPPYLGLPVLGSTCIATPPLIWQTFIFVDVFLKQKRDVLFTFNDVYQAFLNRVHKGHIQIRKIAFINIEETVSSLIHHYLLLLVKIKILTESNNNSFKINQPIYIPRTIDEQHILENTFYQEFSTVIF
jgi:competence protein CoiA